MQENAVSSQANGPSRATEYGVVERRVALGNARDRTDWLHVVQQGLNRSANDLPVVLLHGFPEFWYSWRHQLAGLAAAGFQAFAPDLRGYGRSWKPQHVSNYRVSRLVDDVAQVIKQLAGGRAHVVGHDWGGILAWRLAALRPDLVGRLAILNAPHPMRFREVLKRYPMQWLRSWYTLFFQLPGVPEWLIRRNDGALIAQTLGQLPCRGDAFTKLDLAAYRQVFREHSDLRGPLNYYRAALRYPSDLSAPAQHVLCPTLLLWGEQDPFLGAELTEQLERWVPHLTTVRFPHASHWLQNEVPEEVNQHLIQFFRE